ncbi:MULTISPECIES: sensor histidine kinase [unclassified Rhizobium]|uniref:sensor histidine kinase n=1 Tax=unclassified Rhizobium TaxID=2613769 RepID=UPI00177DC4FB|nr:MULTISPECIES: sensor histidine kinase KdpD [unclassified Rhizobium]MBD8688260.1 sensor histidine kinase KdpD [Rhizobium sp. CFBP 13644]MBD8692715.1 sensor histidine kinase KdpD [Rhizobium sp. CFBP 13717]
MPTHEPYETNRPDPDALLALAEKDRRGKLTIFLGAAPGVGKTYAMLNRAQRLRVDGAEIVVGLAETHGRTETSALLDGLEILPRLSVSYHGKDLQEFDLDGALARKPAIIIVDELAHSNPEGFRHPKRYQDIDELIEAGIDVWTALNIQHLESLSDLVAQITGVNVRERIPDTVLKKADDVLLVDLPPAELITRLQDGKVYLPASARRAADRFFRLGNLTALRELALRRTADRVDDQMIDYLRQNAIEGPWATAERLLVCIGADALSEKVVRVASRLASGLNAPWLVVNISHSDRETMDDDDLRRIDDTFRLAEKLGAETRRVTGSDFVTEIMKLAKREHATQIVIGSHCRRWLRNPLRTSLADALSQETSGIGLHLVTADDKTSRITGRKFVFPPLPTLAKPFGIAFSCVLPAVLLGALIDRIVYLPNISLLFLIAVLGAATYAGFAAALMAAMLSALAYNFFFIPPLYTFTIASPHEVFALFIFVVAAVLAGSLGSRIRDQAKTARARAAAMQALYDFARKLSGTADVDEVLWASVSQLHAGINRNIVLLRPNGDTLETAAAWPPDTELGISEIAAARWANSRKEAAGAGTGTLPNCRFQFRPLTSPHGVVGVCGYEISIEPLDSNAERMFSAIIDQTATAIDRARLSSESAKQAVRLESERYREALLSSISHDLRTPLATITGAVTSLRELGERMTPESRDDLLQSIEEEGARLSRFVANLLDMTRISTGTLQAKREWVDVSDVVRSATERARKYFPAQSFETGIATDLPLLRGDSVLLEQVLFNLLDNSAKYGGGEPVNIYARRDGKELVLSVTDQGKGIPAVDLDRIFEKFYRRSKTDGRSPGTGLGLSIARGFVEALGGRIHAESPAVRKRGTRIVMRFPIEEKEQTLGSS